MSLSKTLWEGREQWPWRARARRGGGGIVRGIRSREIGERGRQAAFELYEAKLVSDLRDNNLTSIQRDCQRRSLLALSPMNVAASVKKL